MSVSNERELPHGRDGYRHFQRVTTRWMDNDAYGHVNNVVYLSWFDTVVNDFLIRAGVLDPQRGNVVGFVVETQCRYLAPLAFPQPIEAGLRVGHVGTSSVRYEIAIFAEGEDSCQRARSFRTRLRRPCDAQAGTAARAAASRASRTRA